MSYVELNCSTWCYPAATKYLWYKEEKNAKTHTEVHNGQIYTVYSDQPGVYYCVATNEIDKQQSASVHLFDGEWFGHVWLCAEYAMQDIRLNKIYSLW